jgi:GNAT superfamily N-acetyltransferase
MAYQYAVEKLDDVRGDIEPLLELHWREIAHWDDIPLAPDWDLYQRMEDMGALRIYTVRTGTSRLIGYAVFFVRDNPHYSTSFQAVQDILFLSPAHRGAAVGAGLVQYAEADLRTLGVQVIYHHIKHKLDFGPLLDRLGYDRVEHVMAKRLY